METAGYVALTRLSGLSNEMDAIAHNIANMSTTGYRREGLIFSEYVKSLDDDTASLSMATADARFLDSTQGSLTQTNGAFDLAIEGDGYFLLETPEGEVLTRAGSFTPNADGELVAPDGARLLDQSGAPIFIPTGAKNIGIATDGTLSIDGQPFAGIGLYEPADPIDYSRRAGSRFVAEDGVVPAGDGVILQGFLESSNVNPIIEIARMIQVQNAYEQGQKFLDKEDERIRSVIRTLSR